MAVLAASLPAAAGGPPLPQEAAPVHLGVKTCSGAPCHGNRDRVGRVVWQNEYVVWSREDRHAQAYEVLLEERARRIARNLLLEKPAHESALCLDCHADFVPPERRGEQFALEDGVGCEACHGGSERWLGPHYAGSASRADLAEMGMYPTDEPVARADLCTSCHVGTAKKFVSHRLLGAGHPRPSFELDTFTNVQPAHFRVDEDYRERGKSDPSPARVWGVGQAVVARERLQALAAHDGPGPWPELAVFDCHACHHPLDELRWRPRPGTGLRGRPGVPRYNDASLLMARLALGALDPAAAERIDRGTRALHAALSGAGGRPGAAVEDLGPVLDDAVARLAAWEVEDEAVRKLARRLVERARAGEYRDYAGAEQAAMAIQSLAATLHERDAWDEERRRAYARDREALLEAVRDADTYDPAALAPLLERILGRLR